MYVDIEDKFDKTRMTCKLRAIATAHMLLKDVQTNISNWIKPIQM